jgi:hypothetical protein
VREDTGGRLLSERGQAPEFESIGNIFTLPKPFSIDPVNAVVAETLNGNQPSS